MQTETKKYLSKRMVTENSKFRVMEYTYNWGVRYYIVPNDTALESFVISFRHTAEAVAQTGSGVSGNSYNKGA